MLVNHPCAAVGVAEHRAEAGSAYCKVHREDHRRQKRRWYSAGNNFRRKASPHDPGPWEAWFAQIKWSPVVGHGVYLDDDDIRTLRSLADALTSAASTVDYVLQRPMEARSSEKLTQQRLGAQLAITRAAEALQRLAKQGPNPLGTLKPDLDT